jgi:hypothetical protein
MDKKTKIMEKTSLRTSKAMFSTCNVFACILQNLDLSLAKFMFTPLSGHVLHDVNNSVKRKQDIIFSLFSNNHLCVYTKTIIPLRYSDYGEYSPRLRLGKYYNINECL